MTTVGAAAYLNVSPHTVRKWVRLRRVPYIKLGGAIRFAPSELERFISQQTVRPVGE